MPDSIWAKVDLVQVRGKSVTAAELEDVASGWVRRLNGTVPVIVNDRCDVAVAAGADGSHLGQDDLPLSEARRLAPPGFLLGASAHSREELLRAAAQGADYAGLGAFFDSPTKPSSRVLDFEDAGLDAPIEGLGIPVLAIGGVDAGRVVEAFRIPAVTGVAVSGFVQGASDPGQAIEDMRGALEKVWRGRHGP